MQILNHITKNQRNPIWFNDRLVPFEDANLHIITHVLNYGTAVFEGIRVYEIPNGTSLFHLDAHLTRLMASAKKFGIVPKWCQEDIKNACIETVKASGQTHGYIRPQIQFGLATPGLGSTSVVEFTVFFWPLGAYRTKEQLNVILSPYERLSPKAGDIEAKVVGFYTNSHFNYANAHKEGADDAIMLDVNGNVAEASSSNVFIVKNGELFTPKPGYILKGITRSSVIELASNDLGIKVNQAVLTVDDLRNADEMFLTGTAAEIDPVGKFDDVTFGNGGTGEITSKIKSLYTDVSGGKIEKYNNWHTFI